MDAYHLTAEGCTQEAIKLELKSTEEQNPNRNRDKGLATQSSTKNINNRLAQDCPSKKHKGYKKMTKSEDKQLTDAVWLTKT